MPEPPSPSLTVRRPSAVPSSRGDGSWSSNITLGNGSNSLTAQVTDLAGNTTTSAAVVYTLSTTRPGGDGEPDVRYRIVGH